MRSVLYPRREGAAELGVFDLSLAKLLDLLFLASVS